MKNEELIPNGAIWHDDPRDRTAESLQEDLMTLNIPNLQDLKTKVNQWRHVKTKSSCTIAGAYLQICQLFGIEATNEELLKIVERCHENMGYDFQGQYSVTGANMMLKYWNTHNPDKKVLFVKVNHKEEAFEFFKNKNFLLGVTYQGNSDYGRDYNADGILDGIVFKNPTYWHRTNKKKQSINDSYFGRKHNNYVLGKDYDTFHELIKNGVYYPTVYIFIKEERLQKDKIEDIIQREEEKRLATVFTNSNSLFRKYLDDEEKKTISSITWKYREKYSIPKQIQDDNKMLAVLLDLSKELLKDKSRPQKLALLSNLLWLV